MYGFSSAAVYSEITAINTILATIGETPINTLNGQLPLDVALARNTLASVTREVQLEGWHFNTEENFTLAVNMAGEIAIPDGTFRVSLPESDAGDVVVRGKRLYDRTNHTYHFASPVTANVATVLPFEDVPEAFKHYITIKAARLFQDRALGSGELHSFSEEDERLARHMAEREDNLLSRPNIARGNDVVFLDGWSVGTTLRR